MIFNIGGKIKGLAKLVAAIGVLWITFLLLNLFVSWSSLQIDSFSRLLLFSAMSLLAVGILLLPRYWPAYESVVSRYAPYFSIVCFVMGGLSLLNLIFHFVLRGHVHCLDLPLLAACWALYRFPGQPAQVRKQIRVAMLGIGLVFVVHLLRLSFTNPIFGSFFLSIIAVAGATVLLMWLLYGCGELIHIRTYLSQQRDAFNQAVEKKKH